MLCILIRGSNFIVDWVIAVHLACTKERVFNRFISGVYNRNSHSMSLLRTKIFYCNPVYVTHFRLIAINKGIRSMSTSVSQKCTINPLFITGFLDAESSFIIGLSKDSKRTNGWIVAIEFAISLHEKDQVLLDDIRSFFSVGTLKKKKEVIMWLNIKLDL